MDYATIINTFMNYGSLFLFILAALVCVAAAGAGFLAANF